MSHKLHMPKPRTEKGQDIVKKELHHEVNSVPELAMILFATDHKSQANACHGFLFTVRSVLPFARPMRPLSSGKYVWTPTTPNPEFKIQGWIRKTSTPSLCPSPRVREMVKHPHIILLLQLVGHKREELFMKQLVRVRNGHCIEIQHDYCKPRYGNPFPMQLGFLPKPFIKKREQSFVLCLDRR